MKNDIILVYFQVTKDSFIFFSVTSELCFMCANMNHNIVVKLIGFLYWNFVMIEFLVGKTWKGNFILNYKLYGSCTLFYVKNVKEWEWHSWIRWRQALRKLLNYLDVALLLYDALVTCDLFVHFFQKETFI